MGVDDTVARVQAVSDAIAIVKRIDQVERAMSECDKVASLQMEAQQTVADAFAFLARKQQEIKGSDVETRTLSKRLSEARSNLLATVSEMADFQRELRVQ